MIQMQTVLDVADNSGAKKLFCIKVLGGSKRKYAGVGDIIVASVREALPNSKVKKGDVVKLGDLLSTGIPSPHDMLKYKGMPETQRFLVNHISEITDNKLDKRDIETIVRGLTKIGRAHV